jgi:LuxR family maltose regulon positive regulatory protein
MRVIAIADQVRVHAAHARRETVVRLLDALDALAPSSTMKTCVRCSPNTASPARSRARTRVGGQPPRRRGTASGRRRRHRRSAHLRQRHPAREGPARRRRWKRGDEAQAMSLLHEAQDLARIAGHARLAADAHPLAARLLAEAQAKRPAATVTSIRTAAQARAMLLTTKEAEVLDLLGKGLPNKAIARALDVSGETVKWHLKNLFVKLSAGSRRHAVERARMLGLVA